MKKTLTINLGGIVFHIDDNAYDILHNYLETIKGYFENSEGRDEIMSDIESRIAEMLQEKLKGAKEVVNQADVQEIISVMGQPEDYIDDDMEDAPKSHQHQQSTYTQQPVEKKRLYRDTEEAMIGGVCSGIGHYFGLDPIWIRLALVIAFFAGFSGFLVYIILWIVMPEAKTSAQKLAMKGQPVTFDNIGKTVEDEIKNVKKKLNNLEDKMGVPARDRVRNFFQVLANFIANLVQLVFSAFGKILGFLFIVIGGITLFSMIFGIFIPTNSVFVLGSQEVTGYSFSELSELIFATSSDYWLTSIGILLITAIPVLALFLSGLYLVFKIKLPRFSGLVLAALWVIGILLSTIGGVSTLIDFSKKSEDSQVVTISTNANDTLMLDLMQAYAHVRESDLDDFFKLEDGTFTIDAVELNVLESTNGKTEVQIERSARGASFEKAEKRAAHINYEFEIDSNTLKLNPYCSFAAKDKWRNQHVQVNVRIPKNTTVYLPKSFKYLIYDIENYHGTYDRDMVGYYWTMTDSGLVSPPYIQQVKEEIAEKDNIQIIINEDGETHTVKIK